MRILIGQPIHEKEIDQLRKDVANNEYVDMFLYPEGYLSDEHALKTACTLAKDSNTTIVTSYILNKKNRAVIIDNNGEMILERAKTEADFNVELVAPLSVSLNGKVIGYILCMEILKGTRDLKKVNEKINFITHPIGVGMFSDEQFDEWINEAKKIAKTYETMIIGTSHADGSYRNCGVSLPISYCIDCNGEPIFISKCDTRSRILDLETKQIEYI